jgi:hypothetical protein
MHDAQVTGTANVRNGSKADIPVIAEERACLDG